MTTVTSFDPIKYSGVWHEIGRYPTLIFEKDCPNAKAIYNWDSEKKIMYIENQCLTENGEIKRSRFGEARIPDMSEPGKLLVKFNGLPATPGEAPYWVHFVDYNTYALVGSPSKQFLWLLSRTPRIPLNDARLLTELVKTLGYDPDKLLMNVGTVVSL